MTNDTIQTIVITSKYAVWSSPREKRNITPFSARMPSFVFILPSPRGHYTNVLSVFFVNVPENISLLKSSHALLLSGLEGPHLQLQCLHLLIQLCKSLLDMPEVVYFSNKGLIPYMC